MWQIGCEKQEKHHLISLMPAALLILQHFILFNANWVKCCCIEKPKNVKSMPLIQFDYWMSTILLWIPSRWKRHGQGFAFFFWHALYMACTLSERAMSCVMRFAFSTVVIAFQLHKGGVRVQDKRTCQVPWIQFTKQSLVAQLTSSCEYIILSLYSFLSLLLFETILKLYKSLFCNV